MKALIKSIDESAWSAVEEKWSPLVDVDEKKYEVTKKKSRWSSEEASKANANREALNIIFGGVDEHQLKCIATYESAKEAWDIL